MILYEFCLRKQELTLKSYEVKETAKSLSCINGGYITYRCLQRLPKESLNTVLDGEYWGYLFYSYNNDLENAKKAFAEYYRNIVIPNKEEKVNKALKEKELAVAELQLLTGVANE